MVTNYLNYTTNQKIMKQNCGGVTPTPIFLLQAKACVVINYKNMGVGVNKKPPPTKVRGAFLFVSILFDQACPQC